MSAPSLGDEIARLLSLPPSGTARVSRMKSVLSEKGVEALHLIEGALLFRHDSRVVFVPFGNAAIASDAGEVALACAKMIDASSRPMHVQLVPPGILDDPASGGAGIQSWAPGVLIPPSHLLPAEALTRPSVVNKPVLLLHGTPVSLGIKTSDPERGILELCTLPAGPEPCAASHISGPPLDVLAQLNIVPLPWLREVQLTIPAATPFEDELTAAFQDGRVDVNDSEF